MTVAGGSLPVQEQAAIAGLRTRLISRLTGLSLPRLRYWHSNGLIEATRRDGRRGAPRLYSWVDYLRLQLAARLDEEGVSARRIRRAVDFLDTHFGEWWLLADPLSVDARKHVLARVVPGAPPLVADAAGQFVLDWPEGVRDVGAMTEQALRDIEARGSLGELDSFSDAVFMSPQINLAQPTVVGTALETHFVLYMAKDLGYTATAETFRIDLQRVSRAVQFEEAVA